MVSSKERTLIEDELKAWKQGLKLYEKQNKKDRIEFCKGAINAIQGLQRELGLYVDEK